MNIHFDTREVIGKLEKISENLTMGLHNALEQSGEIVRAEAVMNCPVDTGRLRGSITSNVEGNTAEISAATDYAIYVEYGTGSKGSPEVAHTTKKQWVYRSGDNFYTTLGQKPQPFLTPALKNNKDKIIKLIREAVKR